MGIHIQAGAVIALDAIVFDGSTSTSELWLAGDDGVELSALAGTLFTLRSGAPPLHLSDLRIASPIRVDAGELEVLRCAFVPGAYGAQQTAALAQSGGVVTIQQSSFANLTGGAVALSGGRVSLDETLFLNNTAERGGALRVVGGRAVVLRCRFESNAAAVEGGAAYFDGGATQFGNQTLLLDNSAPRGRTLYLAPGSSASYVLPAPLARYLFIQSGESLQLVQAGAQAATVDVDFPFACPGGVRGSSYDPIEQSGPWCSGVCPSGYRCPGGTVQPLLCPSGSFCPIGSASGTPCAAGRYSNATGLTSASSCGVCPPGHFCSGGSATPCAENTWNDEYGSENQAGCELCPR